MIESLAKLIQSGYLKPEATRKPEGLNDSTIQIRKTSNDELEVSFSGCLKPGPRFETRGAKPAHVKEFQKATKRGLEWGTTGPGLSFGQEYISAFHSFATQEVRRHIDRGFIRNESSSGSHIENASIDPSSLGIYLELAQRVPANRQVEFLRSLEKHANTLKNAGIHIDYK